MASVYQPFQAKWSAIRVMRRIREDAVISPTVVPEEFRHRHQLDMCDAKLHQIIETLDDPIERAFRRKCSDMQFVDDCGGQWFRLPMLVGPRKNSMVDVTGRTMNTLRLPT